MFSRANGRHKKSREHDERFDIIDRANRLDQLGQSDQYSARPNRRRPIWKTALKIIGAVLLVITIFAGIYTLYARHRLNSFLKTATDTTVETQTYSVATLKTSSFNEISQLKDKKIGFLSTNPYLEKAEKKLREAVDYRTGLENDPEALLSNLKDGNDLMAVTLEKSYLDELESTSRVRFLRKS